MKHVIIVALAAFFLPQTATETHRQKVVDRLKAVMAAFAKVQAISYEVESSSRQSNEINPPIVERSRVTLKRPNFGRIETLGGRGGVRIADGKEMWFAAPKSPTYSRVRLNESTFNRYFHTDYYVSQLFFLKDPETLLRKQGDISLEKGTIDGTKFAVLCWKGVSGYGRLTQTRIWIGENHLPRRVERTWEDSIMGSGGMYRTVVETHEVSDLVLDPAIAADAFTFTPEKGAAEYDLIETNTRGPMPEGAEDATAILEEIRASLKSVESIDYTVEVRLEGAKVDPKTQPMRRRVRAQRPGFIRIDNVSPVEDKTVLVDGEQTWTIEKEKKQYLKTWLLDPYLSAGPENDPWFRLMWERKTTRVLVRGRDVKVGKEKFGDAECRVIQWTRVENYAMTAAGGGTYDVNLKFWIDGEGNPKKVTKSQEHGDVAWTEICTYGPIDRKAKIEPDVFTFTPPADWKSSGRDLEDYMLAVGAKAPLPEGKGLDGKAIKLADYKGQVVVLTFWAAGSPFCVEEMSNLAAVHKDYAKRGASFLAVSYEDSAATIQKHFKMNDLPFTAILQKPFEFSAAFSVRIYPTTYLIDRAGTIAGRWICVESEELKAALEKVLK